MTKDMKELSSGDYTLPFEGELSETNKHMLSNDGDYFLAILEYQEGERKLFRTEMNHKSIHIYHFSPSNVFSQFEMNIENKRVDRVLMKSNDQGVFTMSGVYGEEFSKNVDGIFTFKLDLRKSESLESSLFPSIKHF